MTKLTLPLNQIAISSIDLRRSDLWWREGLGFLPSGGTRLFRGQSLTDVSGLPNAAATTRWLVGKDEWLQIELWQYEKPIPRLMAADFSPNHEGFSRCGVWVKDFDGTLEKLAKFDSLPLSEPIGKQGERRVCVRDPDGIYVELFEQDPIADPLKFAAYDCQVAFRSITITTLDFAASIEFAEQGLGLVKNKLSLHNSEHESLWNLAGAECQRAVFSSGSMLLEFTEYTKPLTQPRIAEAKLNDQGILNVAFGAKSFSGIKAQREQAIKAGATPSKTLNFGVSGCVYMTDPQCFSFEFMYAKPGLAQRLTGFIPLKKASFNQVENKRIKCSVYIESLPEHVFALLANHEGMSDWAGLGKVEQLNPGFTDPSGVGVERLINGKIKEQITCWQPNKKLAYRIIEGGPFVSYHSTISVESDGSGSQVTCVNYFRSRILGLGWLFKIVVNKFLTKVLLRMKNTLEKNK